jgi:energy-coupling factor transport system permease protein
LTGFALLLLYLVFDKTGMPLNNPKIDILRITTDGMAMGLLVSGRFLSIIFLSYIFILTTNPSLIAYTLMIIGLPYRYGFMLVTALRLAPLMEEEGKTIYWSQLVRGVRYDHANPRKIILLVQQFLTPLLISAIRRADHLVFSMEGRGFGQYNKRTFLSRVTPTKLDLMSSLFLVIFYSSLLYLNFRV